MKLITLLTGAWLGVMGLPRLAAQDDPSPAISVRYEAFSLGLTEAAALVRQRPPDEQLYTKLCGLVAAKQAKQENFTILRMRSGEMGISESIRDQIYPTEMEPLATANELTVTRASPEMVAPPLPSHMQTRRAGWMFQMVPNYFENDPVHVQLRMEASNVTRSDNSAWGQGSARAEMSEFETQQIESSYAVPIARPFLLGTLNRPPASKVDADSANRIWFAFVTVHPIKP